MKRGELWWANRPSPIGRRPVVLLSRNSAYARRELVTVAPVTTQIRGIRSEVALSRKDGLRKKSVVNVDTINTIPKAVLESRISMLSTARVMQLEDAIRFALGFPFRQSDSPDLRNTGRGGGLD